MTNKGTLSPVIQLVWYILKQLFTSVSVKVVDIYLFTFHGTRVAFPAVTAFLLVVGGSGFGRNFSYYAGQKCQLSTAEMNSRRAVDMLKNFY